MKTSQQLFTSLFISVFVCATASAAVPFTDDFSDLGNWTTTGVIAPSASGSNLVLNLATADTFSIVSTGGAGAFDFIGNPLTITLNDVVTSADTGTSNLTTFGFANQADGTLFGANSIFVAQNQASRLRVVSYRNGTYNELFDTNDTVESETLATSYGSVEFTVSDTDWSLVTYAVGGAELLNISGAIAAFQFNSGAWADSFLSVQLSQQATRTALTTVGSVAVTAIPEVNNFALLSGFATLALVVIRRRKA